MRRRNIRAQSGFTLVEVLMAAFVLVVGILGVVALVDRANAALGESNGRVGATNLARELTEYSRSYDFDDLTTGRLPIQLHQRTGVSGTSNPWTVVRRNVSYSVAVKVCLFDDPTDGLAAADFTTGDADRPMCERPTAINAKVDSNPDDFRRIVVDLDWKYRGAKAQHVTQNALIVNPSGGLGPRITSFPAPASQITSTNPQFTFTGINSTTSLTSTPAKAVHWNVSNATSGEAAGTGTAPTAWKITWTLGVNTDPTYVEDGSYTINAQAFGDLGVAGNLWSNPVLINRYLPRTPTGFIAGRNPARGATAVDLRWSANTEGDIIGYRVFRVESGGARTPICPSTVGAATGPTVLSCVDSAAPATGAVTYELAAIDRTVIADSSSTMRESASRATSTTPAAGTAPAAPTSLTAATVGGLPRLEWTQPIGAAVAFYRIYRDGSSVADRYASTVTFDPFWIDNDPGTGSHSYRVSAVGATMSESALSPQVLWP
jgi:hypothetical protein